MAWLEDNAPRPGIARAMQEGKTELLGVFRHVSPCRTMGWIVEVTTKHDVVWHVAVKPNTLTHGYRCHLVSRVPWEHWMGDILNPLDKQHNTVYKGDNPEKYRRLKNESARSL